MEYDVMYTEGKNRLFEEFTRKGEALKFAKQCVKKGYTKVFVDTYDNAEDRNLINYQEIN